MQRREVLKGAAGMLGWSLLPWGTAIGGEKSKLKLLFFTRSVGFEHSVVRRPGGEWSHAEKILTSLGQRAGFDVQCTKDGSVFDGDLDPYDAIAFYTCGDLTKPSKDDAPPMTPRGKQRLIEAVAAGKGFVGFHSAADSFHSPSSAGEAGVGLDPYVAMLGGEFVTHGAEQEASLVIAARFPGAGNLGCSEGISFTEEWYALKNFAKDLHVVLVQETQYMKGDCYRRPNYPCTWARMHEKGRVFYTSLGHREEIWTNPFFQAIALGGLNWALGRGNPAIAPNLDKAAPHADEIPKS
jgi:uncharacterized protein